MENCAKCGREGPVNAEGLCSECENEQNPNTCCRMCGRELPLNVSGLCIYCEETENNSNN